MTKKQLKSSKERFVPDWIKNEESWLWSRRKFLRNVGLAGAAMHLSYFQSCDNQNDEFKPLDNKQYSTLVIVLELLFPNDENGPGAIDLNADKYILWMLNDPRMDPEENEFILKGLKWLEEDSESHFKRSFLKLKPEDQEEMLKRIQQESWGESWLSVNLTYIIEAMVSDPIYGFNSEEKGWKWLDHRAGVPRPEQTTMYDNIFQTLKAREL